MSFHVSTCSPVRRPSRTSGTRGTDLSTWTMSCGRSFRSASIAVMIFVSDATRRRSWALCCHTTRPVLASTRIADAPSSFGVNVWGTSAPPARSRSDATVGAETSGVAVFGANSTFAGPCGVAAAAIGCADVCEPNHAPPAPASTIATPTGVSRRNR